LFGVASFSGGLVLLVVGFSVSMAFGWLRHLGVDFRRWACSVVVGFLADGIDKTGLPLSGSPLVICPSSPHPIQPPSTIFVVAHIPLVRGGALRGAVRARMW